VSAIFTENGVTLSANALKDGDGEVSIGTSAEGARANIRLDSADARMWAEAILVECDAADHDAEAAQAEADHKRTVALAE